MNPSTFGLPARLVPLCPDVHFGSEVKSRVLKKFEVDAIERANNHVVNLPVLGLPSRVIKLTTSRNFPWWVNYTTLTSCFSKASFLFVPTHHPVIAVLLLAPRLVLLHQHSFQHGAGRIRLSLPLLLGSRRSNQCCDLDRFARCSPAFHAFRSFLCNLELVDRGRHESCVPAHELFRFLLTTEKLVQVGVHYADLIRTSGKTMQ